ncbi:uncharacterized protein LOC133317632 [Gastrolobium bilobum]|uniref:uncharacterized protein LOC133317632 n=1 Tax=Gastrolobium bilobum TaxID=150636 RepID=UPI002AAFC274|nr:uncharacterized protein LOC133317632 [Gastrolobium bilobum]
MAYRRRQGLSRASTFKEEFHESLDNVKDSEHENVSLPSFSLSSPSLAAQAIKASAATHQPSLAFSFTPSSDSDHQRSKNFDADGNGDSKSGFWGVLAQKAKSILDDDNSTPQHDNTIPQTLKSRSFNTFTSPSAAQNFPSQFKPLYQPPDSNRNMDNPTFRKGLDAITSSLNQLGDTFEKAFEEGRTMVESKTADLRTQIRRKGNGPEDINQFSDVRNPWQQSAQTQNLSSQETQLKASRDVAMATAAKAKLLLRELKTVKADLAFAKARCAQLEEENKLLRDREGSQNQKGHNREDDDLIRLQLETLLAEKARLANENEIYSRENRFLREIVEYHQLTMQDVVYLDEGMEEVTEVYPIDGSGISRLLSISPGSASPPSPDEVILQSSSPPPMLAREMYPVPKEDDKELKSIPEDEAPPSISVSQHAK